MNDAIRTFSVPRCALCNEHGRPLYAASRDRLFAASGEWSHAQCPQCELIWLDPMPVREDVHKAYAQYYTHAGERPRTGVLQRLLTAAKRGYVANHFNYTAGTGERVLGLLPWMYPGRTAELDFSVMWLNDQRHGKLLDVGAGSGGFVEHMGALGWKAEGIDFDGRAVELARTRGLTMHRGGLPEQEFPDESFDAVTMSHSIEHVHEPVAWLAEARRVLRPGGRLAIATPNTGSLLHRRFGQDWFHLDPPRHLHLFNRGALKTALERAGFIRPRIFTSVRDANGAFLGCRSIRRSGRYDMTARPPAMQSVLGRAIQLYESARLVLDRDAGEDLVALAEK